MTVAACQARQVNDEMLCGRCGLTWAVSDDGRPECLAEPDRRAVTRAAPTFYCHTCGQHKPIASKTTDMKRRAICKTCGSKVLARMNGGGK